MSEWVEKKFKKSNVRAKTEFDFYQLKRKSEYLLDCEIERSIDEVTFMFEIKEERLVQEVRELMLMYKYQLLINVSLLYVDVQRLSISLAPENLYFDVNMMPKAMLRDIYDEVGFQVEDFTQQYKSLIGYVLQDKYSYEDFYQGGNQLLGKNKITSMFLDANTMEEVVDILREEYHKLQEKLQYSMIEVDKKKYRVLKLVSRISIVLLVLAIGAGAYFGGYRLHEETIFNKANAAYIGQDYVSVIDTLKGVDKGHMDTNMKYVFAVSIVRSEALSSEQKDNILATVSLHSDVRILEFWISLGQSNIEDAIDIAKQLGNKEYVAYAYMKEKANVENDKGLSGSEREQKLKEIEDNLKNLDIGQEEKNNE